MSDPLKREKVQIERKLDVAIPVSHYLPSRPEKSSCNIEQIYTASNYHFLGPIFFFFMPYPQENNIHLEIKKKCYLSANVWLVF